MASKLLNNLLADERRAMYSSSSTTQPGTGIPTTPVMMPNDKYMRHITNPQTIRENIGIVYNNDSLAQLGTQAQSPEKPSHAGGQNLITDFKYLVINSGDRDWINRTDESAYNYTVNIGGSSLANNNRSINITVNSSLENVTSIKCEALVITNRATQTGFKPSNQPFILVNIESINDTVLGSNKYLDNSLGQMVTKIPLPTSLDNIRYVQMVNQGQTKKYFHTPESRIGRMTINIARADGTLVNQAPGAPRATVDILRAVYVPLAPYNTPPTQTMNIITSAYFNGLDWQAGDIIQIRNYTMRGTNPSNPGFYERVKFNSWMNQEQGHLITSITRTASGPELYNIIQITAPGDWSTVTGYYELAQWFDDLVTKTEIDIDSGTDSGKILNENLQTTVFLTCEVLAKNPLMLLKDVARKT